MGIQQLLDIVEEFLVISGGKVGCRYSSRHLQPNAGEDDNQKRCGNPCPSRFPLQRPPFAGPSRERRSAGLSRKIRAVGLQPMRPNAIPRGLPLLTHRAMHHLRHRSWFIQLPFLTSGGRTQPPACLDFRKDSRRAQTPLCQCTPYCRRCIRKVSLHSPLPQVHGAGNLMQWHILAEPQHKCRALLQRQALHGRPDCRKLLSSYQRFLRGWVAACHGLHGAFFPTQEPPPE